MHFLSSEFSKASLRVVFTALTSVLVSFFVTMAPAKHSRKAPKKAKGKTSATQGKQLEKEAVAADSEALFSATPSRSRVEKPADELQDSQFYSNRTPIHPSVSKLRKRVKTARKAVAMDPATAIPPRTASPAPSSDIGFYDPTDVESVRSSHYASESDAETTYQKNKRNRSIQSVGGLIEQQMVEKTARYLETWTRNTAPWAQGTDLSAAIKACWSRCQESFGRDLPLTGKMQSHVSLFADHYGGTNGSFGLSYGAK